MRTTTEIYKDLAACKRREEELFLELAGLPKQDIEVVEKPPQSVSPVSEPPQPTFKLARFLRGKFALVIWALCKLKAFVRTDGEPVNMRDVANHIGACLGLYFTEEDWKSTLEGNFHVKEPRRFLWKMENEVWQRYLGQKR